MSRVSSVQAGQSAVDLAPVAHTLRRLADLMIVNPEIAEIDVNGGPLLAEGL